MPAMPPSERPTRIDGPSLLSWARRCVSVLERRREEINELNVFPVPDADTGSNMAATMAAALASAEAAAARVEKASAEAKIAGAGRMPSLGLDGTGLVFG